MTATAWQASIVLWSAVALGQVGILIARFTHRVEWAVASLVILGVALASCAVMMACAWFGTRGAKR